MQPLIKLADNTLLITAALGAVTTNVELDTREGVQLWHRTTRVLSKTGAVLYEASASLPLSDATSISVANRIQDAVLAAVEQAVNHGAYQA